MSKLYNRIMNGNFILPYTGTTEEIKKFRREIKQDLEDRVIVSIDNVSSYYLRHRDKAWGFEDYPNIAPPFERFFVEYRIPQHVRSEYYGMDVKPPNPRGHFVYGDGIGFAVVARKYEDIVEEEGWEADEDEDTKWWLHLSRFVSYRKSVVGPYGSFGIGVRADGRISTRSDGTTRVAEETFSLTPRKNEADAIREPLQWAAPIFLALTFMHCKNVTIKDVLPSPKQQKSAKKRGQAVKTYKVLEIEALKEILQHQGNIKKNGMRRALHLCRGHFANYTPEKPLFGRYVGPIWKPPHFRGNKQHGEITKDYTVKAPK